jgi:hypothetical protein
MKLFTFGCSLTHFKGIKEKISNLLNIEFINFAESAGSNQLQVNKFNELVLENEITNEDIIYWQITFMYRRYQRLMKHNLSKIEYMGKSDSNFLGPTFVMSKPNIFDNYERIDLLSTSAWHHKCIDESDVDHNQNLQTLLSTIILSKKITKKVLVVFGWDEVIDDEHLNIFKKYLVKNNIKYVDESYLTYIKKNNLEIMDSLHPTEKSAEFFAENVIYPLLNEIIKDEN